MIAEARTRLAATLAGLGIPVHPYPPGSVTPPCVVIDWGSPLLEPTTSRRAVVGLEARITTSAAAGASSYERIDALIAAAVPLLLTAGIRSDAIPAPTSADDGRTHTAVLPVYIAIIS